MQMINRSVPRMPQVLSNLNIILNMNQQLKPQQAEAKPTDTTASNLKKHPNSATSFNRQPKIIGAYQIGEILGRGACGKVFKGLNFQTGKLVAIKQIKINTFKEEKKQQLMQEIDLLKKLEHQNIVKYIDSLKTEQYINIIMEYVESGSLDSLIKKFGKFPENLVAIYIHQVLQGLVYLHKQGVTHRDIKGANILTTKDGIVKLADFGVATKLTGSEINNSAVGTPYWMAPEVIEMNILSQRLQDHKLIDFRRLIDLSYNRCKLLPVLS